MHILYLSVPGGGLDTNVRVLAPALIREGHRVSVIYLDFPGEKPGPSDNSLKGVATYHATVGSLHYYARRATFGATSLPLIVRAMEYARALEKMVAEVNGRERVDLVELPEVLTSRRGLKGIPYVVRLHASAWMCRVMFQEPQPAVDRIERRLEASTLQGASGISAPSRSIAGYIQQACRVKQVIEIIPYPVDIHLFKPGTGSAKPTIILFVGRVEKRKGADVLMRAIPLVRAKYPDSQFVFVGRVADELEELVTSFAKDPDIKFPGMLPRDELIRWYQRAAIFAAPTLWDNSPNTVYEAMACGTAVVATRVGGVPELVEEGVTGLLVPPRDENALAQAIIELLDDPTRRQKMGAQGRERAVENFAVEKVMVQTLEFYERAMTI